MNPKHQNAGSRNTQAKLTWRQVGKLREAFQNGKTQAELARRYGISDQQASNIVKNKAWYREDYCAPQVIKRGPRG